MSEFKNYILKNKSNWNKNITRHYWKVILFSFLTELLIFFISNSSYNPYIYLFKYVILPTAILIIVMLTLKVMMHLFPNLEDYLILITGSIMITILSYINITVTVLGIAYILPIIISIFYYDRSKVIFAFITNVTLFLTMNILLFRTSDIFTLSNLITSIVIMGITILVARGMIKEMASIMNHIKNELETKQHLIAEKKLLKKSLRLDGLTNLYNHATFQSQLQNVINEYDTNKVSIGLAIIDIDNFKKINDSFGHQKGDQVIKQVASIIKHNITKYDLAARYGGEEFTIILIDHTKTNSIHILESIRKDISTTLFEEINDYQVTISIGFREYTKDLSKDQFFDKTDKLLYDAKRSGKNKVIYK